MIFFTATVLPLICTPGPDMLFVASRALLGGASAGLRATAGICLGYMIHSGLAAVGVAAIIAASPMLFQALRWLGVAYLIYLGLQLMRSAVKAGKITLSVTPANGQLWRGFLTAFLNPKGMMIYFAILPQFMQQGRSIPPQALVLSAIFIALCGIVYASMSLGIAAVGRNGGFSDCRRRWVEGTAGALLLMAAGRLAAN
ncbi:threonine/homoserine/homoserine lactone efflux protein [Phyllobacterium sp. 1468]|uniref:LysE family translocator n=1 Tax=Phyllobacterium sp. 1468 TaxID=2817759 RepID=UPI0028640222|nr:LysE family translocator [Phyllobacterium sp. 1468]MDR6635663.1 threonine/homoserine/homoserine lactone efflux protein [Phyllobacterium sp. 1468]